MKRDAGCVLALAVIAVALTWGTWGDPPQWKPDALFYQAQMLEVQGVEWREALHRVFTGPLAEPRLIEERTEPGAVQRLTDPEWVEYSSQFYRRRWVFPILGAVVEPVLGVNSLQIVSLAGFVMVGPLLFLLLRQRFGRPASLFAAGACVLLPPLRYWAEQPQTDSMAVAVEALALVLGVLALDRSRRWLLPWALGVLLLGFTRDASFIVVAGAAWVALRVRTRRAVWLAGLGALAALPPPLLFGAPLKTSLAYMFGNFVIPDDTSWGYILENYPKGLRRIQINDMNYLRDHPLTAVAAVAGLVALYAIRRRGDPYFTFLRGAGVAALAYPLLQPNYTALRLELVVVPFVGVGLALLTTAVLDRLQRRAPIAIPSTGTERAPPP